MSSATITGLGVLTLILLAIGFEAFVLKKDYQSISKWLTMRAITSPIFVFTAGVFAGHWFFPLDDTIKVLQAQTAAHYSQVCGGPAGEQGWKYDLDGDRTLHFCQETRIAWEVHP